jgi:ABC-type dipeptide/oligopeptide/nickel transport system permease component
VVVTVLRVIPALVVVMAAAGALATRRGRVGDQVRRLVRGVSSLPLFLGCYLGIIVVNRLTHAYIEGGGSAPGYFALPLGDGRPHIVRWALEVLVLAMGDGALALAVSRVRERVEELETQPFVLAAEVNGGGGLAAIRRHLVSTLRLTTAELIPLLLGGTLVMETIFLERGVGRVLVKCLEARDLPVVGAIVFIGLTLSFVLRGILREAP